MTNKVIAANKLAEARSRAEEERKRIFDEGVALGERRADRLKALAYMFIGFVVGALCTGVYTAALSTSASFTAGAVIDRTLARTLGPPVAAPRYDDGPTVTAADEYLRNTDAARRDACREGVRDPRTGLCPREPANR